MSRISKKPLIVPENVKFSLLDNKIFFTGKHGELSYDIDHSIDLIIKNNEILVSTSKKKKQCYFRVNESTTHEYGNRC